MLNRFERNGVQPELFDEPRPFGSESTFLLHQLEVFNWGSFKGLHRAEFDPLGTAIIGPTGSGKTSLVDALMTLLVSNPRYNLASTGGHESDRTLFEYVRGINRSAGNDVARPGKTISGISASYRDGKQCLTLAVVFWTEGPGNAGEDLKRRWIFSLVEDQLLEQWLRMVHEDGVRELTRLEKETVGLRTFTSKKPYLERVRTFFDVSENAFTLLNRAAGLKQINSISEIFRELVLEDHSAFTRAIEVAAEFDNLSEIHAELETAKRQQESLVPVAEEYDKLLKSQQETEQLRTLKRILPIWFAKVGEQKWSAEAARLTECITALNRQIDETTKRELLQGNEVDALRERYLKLGGNIIGTLEQTIAAQKQLVQEKGKNANEYQKYSLILKLKSELTEQSLIENQAILAKRRATEQREYDEQLTKSQRAWVAFHVEQDRLKDIEQAIRQVKQRPGSNIPPAFQDFRSELAARLVVDDNDLPFLAELIEVQSAESQWRGAIERAIGSERLRILVPDSNLKEAIRWVNQRDNRLHVRLQSASIAIRGPKFFSDGYVQKLNFKQHPGTAAAKQILGTRDLHCVVSADLLRTTELALTAQGMMSGRNGRYEKQDQKRLDEGWMTGFDNKDQLNSLTAQVMSLQQSTPVFQSKAKTEQKRTDEFSERLRLIGLVVELDFSDIDLPQATAMLAQSEQTLDKMLDPNSDASQAKKEFDIEMMKLKGIQKDLSEQNKELSAHDFKLADANEAREASIERMDSELTDNESSLADSLLESVVEIPAKRLKDKELECAREVANELEKQEKRVADNKIVLVKRMNAAKNVDTGFLADVATDIDDVPYYLERLRILVEEALPEKRTRFLEYLNRSSDQGVTQLLASIDEEVDLIIERIGELNHTLAKVKFQSNQSLQLVPQRVSGERLRALDAAMRKVRTAALKDDDGESHFKALQEMVTILRHAGANQHLQESKALLDPRFRIDFYVVEVDRDSGVRSQLMHGSQSGSGGEKELMATHVLTASLSYALCPAGASVPLYGTVIMDEAFSKSSRTAANLIVESLRIFHLTPIFVTPNKEISLLKQHTRKVICVQRRHTESSLASISWERLQQLAPPQ